MRGTIEDMGEGRCVEGWDGVDRGQGVGGKHV